MFCVADPKSNWNILPRTGSKGLETEIQGTSRIFQELQSARFSARGSEAPSPFEGFGDPELPSN